MKRVAFIISFIFLLGITFCILVGWLSKASFSGQIAKRLEAPPEVVWEVITDIEKLPLRRGDVAHIELEGQNELGFAKWKEHTKTGGYLLREIAEQEDTERLMVNITESNIGMTGSWLYELEKDGQGCYLTITEHSLIEQWFLRMVMEFRGREYHLLREMDVIEKAVEPDGLVRAGWW